MNDPINPNHYKQGGFESIDAIKAFMGEEAFKGFLKGNCQKYLFRYEKKNGIEDLCKCQWYLERLIEVLQEEKNMADYNALQVRQGPPIAFCKD
jgi:predicted ArsR family transcriptional regulator